MKRWVYCILDDLSIDLQCFIEDRVHCGLDDLHRYFPRRELPLRGASSFGLAALVATSSLIIYSVGTTLPCSGTIPCLVEIMAQVRPAGPVRSTSAHLFESKLSQQLQPDPPVTLDPSRSPKSRSLSDASKPTPTQPATGDLSRPPSKDDSSLPTLPATPSRSNHQPPSLSLNLPAKTAASPSISRAPLSPQLDSSQIYGSPNSVLPRRSRGLDFSRACTNLHHSTLAESSPDSSPTIGGRGVTIPQRRGSPGLTSVPPFSTSGPADRTAISSSVSSVNMMESDTSSSDDDDEAMMPDRDDVMLNTPQAARVGSGPSPFAAGNVQSPGNEWMGGYSQAAASLMSFQRARFRKGGRSRNSSSSASGNSSKPSPGPHSPPVMKSVENPTAGYFGPRQNSHARRESLSLGTRDLRLSDMSDDGEGRARGGSPTATSHSEGGPLGVIRRAVTRRGSLLVSRWSLFCILLLTGCTSPKPKHSPAFAQLFWRRARRWTVT